MFVKWLFKLMNSCKLVRDDKLHSAHLESFCLPWRLVGLVHWRESDFAVNRSESETCLHHLLAVWPWSINLIFLKLFPRIRLMPPNLQVFSEITDLWSVLSLVHRRCAFPSFPLCFRIWRKCRSESLSQPQAKKTIWEKGSESSWQL